MGTYIKVMPKVLVAVDGYSPVCTKKTMEHAGFIVADHLDVTWEGTEIVHEFKLSSDDILLITENVKEAIKARRQSCDL